MSYLNGHIISGQFNDELNVFSVQKVKNFLSESSLNEKQVQDLYHYLKRNEGTGQVITLQDQLLVSLNEQEVAGLIDDLQHIQSNYQY
ncbi:hypothetical protein [Bacillus alkalicellulosilyticus]|uniref:hypothetical protein n=1 Tax=Alkalihalobacterium alkalicellulosilyticum TaxID=1912214 RepID=UPI0009989E04|nr:hypothetical protein [Bacillus alkalicellulosilyticus]